ncbi:1-deoxy-D-xylulose-5-phosphate reductoisomerase [candidate division KSB1 bacterium]|nr:1-deoxy-D-xylulose-5-phosphate reductoisomerase [candidate division KSB1 bacterium]
MISIWGSTGSIGTQTLDFVALNPDAFQIHCLTTHNNVDLLLKQTEQFRPKQVVITGDCDPSEIQATFQKYNVHILFGKLGLLEAASNPDVDLVVNALVGAVGLEATLLAIDSNVDIALANKEVLVMAGELVMNRVSEKGVRIVPIDSEHSALYQCLQGENPSQIRRIILTASGGPFLNRDAGTFPEVTIEEALSHPNWVMGQKVTIDSATLMNKGLEIIEARWLFNVQPEQIDVVIHPQSFIHSMVEFVDGSIKAQLSTPDMHVPIAYALSGPDRWESPWGSQDFTQPFSMDFQPPDRKKFASLNLAIQSLKDGGTAPAIFNAADEVAVNLFLSGKIRFHQISEIVEQALNSHRIIDNPNLEDILTADNQVRQDILNKYESEIL